MSSPSRQDEEKTFETNIDEYNRKLVRLRQAATQPVSNLLLSCLDALPDTPEGRRMRQVALKGMRSVSESVAREEDPRTYSRANFKGLKD